MVITLILIAIIALAAFGVKRLLLRKFFLTDPAKPFLPILFALAFFGITVSSVLGQADTSTSQPTPIYNEPPQLAAMIDQAMKQNPSLQAAALRASAVKAGAQGQRAWPAPKVGVEFYQAPVSSFPNPLKDQMEIDYSLEQMIMFPGKLSLMSKAEKERAGMASQEAGRIRSQTLAQLKTIYYDIFLLDRQREINAENQELLRNFYQIARSQYEVGMANFADAVRAQTELSSIQNEGFRLDQNRQGMIAMLNALLALPTDRPLEKTDSTLVPPPVPWSADAIKQIAVESRPDLKAMQHNIQMASYEHRAAKRERFPDLMAKGQYKNMLMDSTEDFWSLMFQVEIPIAPWAYSRTRSKVSQSQHELSRAQKEYESMENMVEADVEQALVKIRSNQELMNLYLNTTLPQAEQSLAAVRAAYGTGKTDFLMLLDASKMVLMAKMEYYMATMNTFAGQAELEQAVGLQLKEIATKIRSKG